MFVVCCPFCVTTLASDWLMLSRLANVVTQNGPLTQPSSIQALAPPSALSPTVLPSYNQPHQFPLVSSLDKHILCVYTLVPSSGIIITRCVNGWHILITLLGTEMSPQ